MEKGINLSMTRSLADFDAMLERAIEAASTKELVVALDLDESSAWKYQVGKYVEIIEDDDRQENAVFWIGYGWEENEKRESMLWLEFDAKTCPARYWDKIKNLARTSGKYYREVGSEFAQEYMNAWVHFFLREEYLNQLYDSNIGIKSQETILTEFIDEVLTEALVKLG